MASDYLASLNVELLADPTSMLITLGKVSTALGEWVGKIEKYSSGFAGAVDNIANSATNRITAVAEAMNTGNVQINLLNTELKTAAGEIASTSESLKASTPAFVALGNAAQSAGTKIAAGMTRAAEATEAAAEKMVFATKDAQAKALFSLKDSSFMGYHSYLEDAIVEETDAIKAAEGNLEKVTARYIYLRQELARLQSESLVRMSPALTTAKVAWNAGDTSNADMLLWIEEQKAAATAGSAEWNALESARLSVTKKINKEILADDRAFWSNRSALEKDANGDLLAQEKTYAAEMVDVEKSLIVQDKEFWAGKAADEQDAHANLRAQEQEYLRQRIADEKTFAEAVTAMDAEIAAERKANLTAEMEYDQMFAASARKTFSPGWSVTNPIGGAGKSGAGSKGARGEAVGGALAMGTNYSVSGWTALFAGGMILAPLVEATKSAAQFNNLLTKLVATAGEAPGKLAEVRDGMLKIASDWGQMPDKVASAMYIVESAGHHGAEGLSVLTEAAKLARATQMDTVDAAKLLAKTMIIYGQSSQDAAKDSDIFTRAIHLSLVEGKEYGPALAAVAQVGHSVGLSIGDTASMLDVLTQRTKSAYIASTYLKNFLSGLANPTKAMRDGFASASEALAKSGDVVDSVVLKNISLHKGYQEVTKDQDGGVKVLDAIQAATRGHIGLLDQLMPDLRKNQTLQSLINQGLSEYKIIRNQVNASEGATAKANAEQKQSLQDLGSAYGALSISIGEKFVPQLMSLAHTITSAVQWFNSLSSATQNNILEFTEWTGIALVLTGFAKILTGSLSILLNVVRPLFTGIGALVGVENAASLSTMRLAGAMATEAVSAAAAWIATCGPLAIAIAAVIAVSVGLKLILDKVGEGTRVTTDDLIKHAEAQKTAADSAQTNASQINALVTQYESLKKIVNPTKEQLGEMQSILDDISKLSPTLVTGYSKQGHAIDIVSDAAKLATKNLKDMAHAAVEAAHAVVSANLAKQGDTIESVKTRVAQMQYTLRTGMIPKEGGRVYGTLDSSNPYAFQNSSGISSLQPSETKSGSKGTAQYSMGIFSSVAPMAMQELTKATPEQLSAAASELRGDLSNYNVLNASEKSAMGGNPKLTPKDAKKNLHTDNTPPPWGGLDGGGNKKKGTSNRGASNAVSHVSTPEIDNFPANSILQYFKKIDAASKSILDSTDKTASKQEQLNALDAQYKEYSSKISAGKKEMATYEKNSESSANHVLGLTSQIISSQKQQSEEGKNFSKADKEHQNYLKNERKEASLHARQQKQYYNNTNDQVNSWYGKLGTILTESQDITNQIKEENLAYQNLILSSQAELDRQAASLDAKSKDPSGFANQRLDALNTLSDTTSKYWDQATTHSPDLKNPDQSTWTTEDWATYKDYVNLAKDALANFTAVLQNIDAESDKARMADSLEAIKTQSEGLTDSLSGLAQAYKDGLVSGTVYISALQGSMESFYRLYKSAQASGNTDMASMLLGDTRDNAKAVEDYYDNLNKTAREKSIQLAKTVAGDFTSTFTEAIQDKKGFGAGLDKAIHTQGQSMLEGLMKSSIEKIVMIVNPPKRVPVPPEVRAVMDAVGPFSVSVDVFKSSVLSFAQAVQALTGHQLSGAASTGSLGGSGLNVRFGAGTGGRGPLGGSLLSGAALAASSWAQDLYTPATFGHPATGTNPNSVQGKIALANQATTLAQAFGAKSTANGLTTVSSGLSTASGLVKTAADVGKVGAATGFMKTFAAISPWIGLATSLIGLASMFGSHKVSPSIIGDIGISPALKDFSTKSSSFSGQSGLRSLLGVESMNSAGVHAFGQSNMSPVQIVVHPGAISVSESKNPRATANEVMDRLTSQVMLNSLTRGVKTV